MTIATKGIQTTLHTRQIATIMQTSAILTIQHIIQVVVENKDTSRKSYMQTSGTNVLLFFCAQILEDVKTLKGPFANGTIMIVK